MYYGSGTVDRIVSGHPAGSAVDACSSPRQMLQCADQMAALFCMK